jgi:hypothetical protein
LWVLVSGLPPESAVWRLDELPPTQQQFRELLKQHHEWAKATAGLLAGERVRLPGPPEQLAAPSEADPKTARNVVSISDFVAANPNRAKSA